MEWLSLCAYVCFGANATNRIAGDVGDGAEPNRRGNNARRASDLHAF